MKFILLRNLREEDIARLKRVKVRAEIKARKFFTWEEFFLYLAKKIRL